MRKNLLLAIAFALGIWAYLLMGVAAPKLAPAALKPPAMGAEDGINAYFSPDGGCERAVVEEIAKATQSIDCQAYLFSSAKIAQAMVGAYDRGVHVRVVLDKSQKNDLHSSVNFLLAHHVPVYLDDRHPIAHNKIMLIDGKSLMTGSFNFTKAADQKNAENLLILHNRPKIVSIYETNFEAHLNHSIPAVGSRQ